MKEKLFIDVDAGRSRILFFPLLIMPTTARIRNPYRHMSLFGCGRRPPVAACVFYFPPDPPTPLKAKSGLEQLASSAMLKVLFFYRQNITDNMPPNCRFVPSCSRYMIEAIETYGAWRGFVLSLWRIIRCNPTGGAGYDPVQWPPVSYGAGSWTQ